MKLKDGPRWLRQLWMEFLIAEIDIIRSRVR